VLVGEERLVDLMSRYCIFQIVLSAAQLSHRHVAEYLMQADGELPEFDPTFSDMPHAHMHIQILRMITKSVKSGDV
jgi:hypothetical protein